MKYQELFRQFICIFLFLFFVGGCFDTQSLNYVQADDVILAFGDSLTVGVGVSEENSYPNKLAMMSGRRVVAAGVSGEETKNGLLRLPKVLDEVQPSLMILMEGGNDILRSRDLRETKQNLAAMIELAQARGVDIVLIGVPEKKIFSDVAPLYVELADQYDIVFIDDVLSSMLRKNKYKSDAVHLNEKGYQVLAETLHNVLVKYGAL